MTDSDQKKNSLIVAHRKAGQILAEADPEAICDRTGASFTDGAFQVEFLGKAYQIRVPDVAFVSRGLPTIGEVLILHYLTSQENKPVRGEFVNFRSIPGGMFYAMSFQRRAVDRLLASFGKDPERLLDAAQSMGGQRWTTGDYSSVIPVFPRIDIVVQIYRGDDEFPPQANILFSDSVVNFLPVEDTAFLGGWVVSSLAREAR